MTIVPARPTNNDRARWADAAVDAFTAECGDSGDEASNVQDLLADLLHLCDARGFAFGELLRRAKDHYRQEIAEGPKADPDFRAPRRRRRRRS